MRLKSKLKYVAWSLIAAVLLWQSVRIRKIDRDMDRIYAKYNHDVADVINQQTEVIAFLRAEIADIMVELTRRGLIPEAPPEQEPQPKTKS